MTIDTYQINSTQSFIYCSNESPLEIQELIEVLEINTKLMEKYFSLNSPSNMQIVQNSDFNTPEFDTSGYNPTIKLTVPNIRYYDQYVFQFSHELCHVLIGKEKEHSHQTRDAWFEEVICEVSSRFFLEKISSDHRMAKILYPVPTFKMYASDRKNMISTFDVRVLSNEESHLLSRFRSEIENRTYGNDDTRNRYNYIANFIHPIFEENPNLWQEVYLIRNFSNEKGFIENLMSWKNESQRDENKESIQTIINLFSNN